MAELVALHDSSQSHSSCGPPTIFDKVSDPHTSKLSQHIPKTPDNSKAPSLLQLCSDGSSAAHVPISSESFQASTGASLLQLAVGSSKHVPATLGSESLRSGSTDVNSLSLSSQLSSSTAAFQHHSTQPTKSVERTKQSESKPPSLSDLIRLSNQQDLKLPSQRSAHVTSNPSGTNSLSKLVAQKSDNSSVHIQRNSVGIGATDPSDSPSGLSLSELAKLHVAPKRGKHVSELDNMLSAVGFSSSQSPDVNMIPLHEHSLPTVSFQLSQDYEYEQFDSVVCRSVSLKDDISEQLRCIHKIVRERLSRKYHAQFMSQFDFSNPSPDDIVKKSQKKVFK